MTETLPVNPISTSTTEGVDAPRKPLLLIVEDDPRTNSVLRRIFQSKGWDVQSASTITEGLALLNPEPVALILDIMLPDGDGLTVLKKVRQDQMKTRVVVTTGIEDSQRIEAIKDLHPEALLHKPIDLEILLLALSGP